VVAELVELVEDDEVLARSPQFPALVEDFLDVALAARRRNDLACNLRQPLEPLAAHAFRQDGNGLTAEQRGIVRAPAAVVAGGGPDGLLRRRVELTRDQPRDEAAERRADLVRAGGEPFADEDKDTRVYTGQCLRELQIVCWAEATAMRDRLVLPGDAKEVARVDIPQADAAQLRLDAVGNQRRIPHLGEGRDDDVTLACALHCACETIGVDGQINHVLLANEK